MLETTISAMGPAERSHDHPQNSLHPTHNHYSHWNRTRRIQQEACLLLWDLALPTFVVQIGSVLPNCVCASYVGRSFGPTYLSGFTLAVLLGNLFQLSLLQGFYTAADTLSPQAFAAGNLVQVGYIAIRGYVASIVIVILPLNAILLWKFTSWMLWMGEDPQVATVANQWYRIYVWALPFYALFNVTWKFLSAQAILRPLLYVSAISCLFILPVSMEILTKLAGFGGSAGAIVIFQSSQAVLLIAYLYWKQPYTPGTWPTTICWKNIFQWEQVRTYLLLGMGGMLATSEWIYWELLSLMIGTLGVIPLSVHTIPTQVLMVAFMVPLSIGIALAVRLGATLPHSVKRAQQLTMATLLGSALLFGALSIGMFHAESWIVQLFSRDPDIRNGCHTIWWKVSVYYFNLSVYGINMGIATGLGQQWKFGIVTIVCLWGCSLPGMYWYAIKGGGGLDLAWSFIYYPYIAMNLYFVWDFATTDWRAIQLSIRKREGMDVVVAGVEAGDDDEIDGHARQSLLLRSKVSSDVSENAEEEMICTMTIAGASHRKHSPHGTMTGTIYGSILE